MEGVINIMRKQPEITEKTRKIFIDAFCELYCQKPIEKITVQEIANKTGFNRSTFYQYFTDIYNLLDYIENDLLSYMKEELQKNNMRHRPTTQTILLLFESKETCLNAIWGNYGSIRFFERVKKEFPLDMIEKSFPKDDPKTPYLIEFHISTSLSLFRLWQRRNKDLPPEELFDLIESLYSKGISFVSAVEKKKNAPELY